MRPKPNVDRLDIEVALRNREFEIQLFWQRSNYFLVLITALGAGVIATHDSTIAQLLSVFGVAACWLWFKTNLGSRFWQMFWEAEVERLAPNHKLKSFQMSTGEIRSWLTQLTSVTTRPVRGWIDREVLKKPSVTYHMILLSLVALVFWVSIFVFYSFVNIPRFLQVFDQTESNETLPPKPSPDAASTSPIETLTQPLLQSPSPPITNTETKPKSQIPLEGTAPSSKDSSSTAPSPPPSPLPPR